MYVMIKRYADDCRAVMLHPPTMKEATSRYLDYYKHNCYSKPCELEDENDTPCLEFLQEIFIFSPTNCIARYQSKNFMHFVEYGRAKFRSMQHYYSYCNSPSNTRYSTIAGKLSEIDSFSSSDEMRMLGVLSLIPDLVALQYPTNLVTKALYARSRRRDKEPIWSSLAPVTTAFMQWLQTTCNTRR